MDFSEINNKEREFLKKDFSVIDVLMKRIRESFVSGNKVSLEDLNFDGIVDYKRIHYPISGTKLRKMKNVKEREKWVV